MPPYRSGGRASGGANDRRWCYRDGGRGWPSRPLGAATSTPGRWRSFRLLGAGSSVGASLAPPAASRWPPECHQRASDAPPNPRLCYPTALGRRRALGLSGELAATQEIRASTHAQVEPPHTRASPGWVDTSQLLRDWHKTPNMQRPIVTKSQSCRTSRLPAKVAESALVSNTHPALSFSHHEGGIVRAPGQIVETKEAVHVC